MHTKIVKINPVFPEHNLIIDAANVLKSGGLVVFPTETVYGIGADSSDKKAIERLYEVKKRPGNKPFTVHIADFDALLALGLDLSNKARDIIDKYWPGPVTILANNKKGEKIGVRMPRHNVAIELIREANLLIAAPSANISGNASPVTGKDAIFEMNGAVEMILDAGPAEIGRESTILDVTTQPFTIVREGAVSSRELLAVYRILFVCTGNTCRSVMAKSIMEKLIEEGNLSSKVYIDSAGTSTYTGISASSNTIKILEQDGIDASIHKGKNVTLDLLKKFDMIFVMEASHKNIMLNMMPQLGSKVRLLRQGGDVPDPIGRQYEEYQAVHDIIKEEVENIFLDLCKNLCHK